MKNIAWMLSALFLVTSQARVPAASQPASHLASSQVVDCWVTSEEKKLLDVAEAMPADKYAFAPTNGEYKGTRTFAQQLKHAAADNYILGAAILRENPPADAGDETGPDSLETKADVIEYVNDSFAYLHKAVANIDDMNAVIEISKISPMPRGTATRLGLAVEALIHGYNHYGQMVEYLRMNGIVPPASRLDGGSSNRGAH